MVLQSEWRKKWLQSVLGVKRNTMATIQMFRRSRIKSKWADLPILANAAGVVKSTQETAAQVSKPNAIRLLLSL